MQEAAEALETLEEAPSRIVSEQFKVSEWHKRLGGGIQADSIMDRIIHNSYELPATDNNLHKLYDSKKARSVISFSRNPETQAVVLASQQAAA